MNKSQQLIGRTVAKLLCPAAIGIVGCETLVMAASLLMVSVGYCSVAVPMLCELLSFYAKLSIFWGYSGEQTGTHSNTVKGFQLRQHK